MELPSAVGASDERLSLQVVVFQFLEFFLFHLTENDKEFLLLKKRKRLFVSKVKNLHLGLGRIVAQ